MMVKKAEFLELKILIYLKIFKIIRHLEPKIELAGVGKAKENFEEAFNLLRILDNIVRNYPSFLGFKCPTISEGQIFESQKIPKTQILKTLFLHVKKILQEAKVRGPKN